ncbi:hypothetical protein EKH57_15570 [Halorubrum sp. BOL3-1]|uniref:DUF6603 domain-containing protein n=1 Tax=Halorubrum sp. BOL3-1 TaxID=2497325 RepID=UPI001004E12E|nr:DUF6603 domain-containing protein [Halorubrum sp. BOL3-1]QAU14010.1 hypothetical protein EKH57_15570 [Halorubrum sp. BOL3-1]
MADDDTGGPPTEVAIAVEFVKVVQPVITACENGPESVARLLDDMGVSDRVMDREAEKVYDTIESDVVGNGADIEKAVVTLAEEVQEASDPEIEGIGDLDDVDWKAVAEEVGTEEVVEVGKSAKAVYDAVKSLTEIDLEAPDAESLGDAVLDFLLVGYFDTHYTDLHGLLTVTGVIVVRDDVPDEFRFSRIGDLVSDPVGTARDVVGWGLEDERLLAVPLLHQLQKVLLANRTPASRMPVSAADLTAIADVASVDDLDEGAVDALGQQLVIPIVYHADEDGNVELGLRLVPVPPAAGDALPGLSAVTYGSLSAGASESLGEDWELSVDASGDLADRGVLARPSLDEGLDVSSVSTDGDAPGDTFVWTASLAYVGDPESFSGSLLNTAVGTLALQSVAVEAGLKYANDDLEFTVALVGDGRLDVEARGGFLEKVVPEPITYDFETTLGWSSRSGFYLENGGTLEASIPANVDLGFFTIEETFLGISPQSGGDGDAPGVPVHVGTSPSVDLGFLQADVERVGIEFDVRFPADGDGNFGAVDVQVGFKPPNGIGLSVDAGPVTGGGRLSFYPDENRYTGTLQLQVGDIGLNAVGLLQTELPGGQDGYSLLILITAEIPPIQLGFGFALTGVGGLLGINRQAKMDELGATVRTGSLDSVLFPEDVVENGQQIVSDLRTIFPPMKDRHVVGPMARLTWGSPVVLRMKVGVILEIPTWKVAIAGIFNLDLPDEEAAIVDLNLAIVGVIDIPNRRIAIDASLYDSRIVTWTVSGDMAMRLSWGDESRFVLSIGGFHPRFETPPKFPELDRVKVEMSPSNGNPRLGMQGYLAVTSNTFQVGAKAFLHAQAGPATVDGELGFDALFQFDPFKFVIDFMASVSVEVKGKGLSLTLDGTLKGPGPFRVKGKVHIDILLITIAAKVDETFGESGSQESLPASTVMPELTEELGKPANWSAQLPPAGDSLVTVRQPGSDGGGDGGGAETDAELALVHPLGEIGVRQTVVPLSFRIDLFGNAEPADYEEFRIADVEMNGDSAERGRRLKEKFAPAKYRKMSDGEKLDSPSFVERDAGVAIDRDDVYYPDGTTEADGDEFSDRTVARLEFETRVIDEQEDQYATPLPTLGSFAAVRPESARFGLPQEKVRTLVDLTAAGERFRDRVGYATVDDRVYGVQGGTVIGTRTARGDREVDRVVTAETEVLQPDEAELVVDDAALTTGRTVAREDVIVFGEDDADGAAAVDGAALNGDGATLDGDGATAVGGPDGLLAEGPGTANFGGGTGGDIR